MKDGGNEVKDAVHVSDQAPRFVPFLKNTEGCGFASDETWITHVLRIAKTNVPSGSLHHALCRFMGVTPMAEL